MVEHLTKKIPRAARGYITSTYGTLPPTDYENAERDFEEGARWALRAVLASDWLRTVKAEAWSEGRRDSIDLRSDALGVIAVALNADNPYKP